jgi:lactoylglutathione lyase
MLERLMLYSDGGARGNPGPAAIAYVAVTETGQIIKADSRVIGVATNNQAEYEALIAALEFAVAFKAQEVTCHLDSELVGKQMTGEYRVKDAALQKLWRKAQERKTQFQKVSFVNVPRTNPYIQRADALVNEALDKEEQAKGLTGDSGCCEPLEAKTMFVHASIRTSNMEKSIDFYTRLLGMKVLSRREIKAANAEIASLQHPAGKGCTLELTFYRSQTKFSQPAYEECLFDHLGFEVADIAKTIEAMRKENVTITDEPFQFSPTSTIAFIEDPDGVLIELIERK